MSYMPGYTLPEVELFASGTYRGREYTPADVARICVNAKRLPIDPPVVTGHEDEDADGNPTASPERTDAPADGWVDPGTVRVEWRGDRLYLLGRLTDVPAHVAAKVRARRLRKVSAEIYDDFVDDAGASHGKALRRVSLLGGEVPQVKGLADLPDPVRQAFAERAGRPGPARLVPAGGRATADGTYWCFAEVAGVTRDENKAALLAAMPGVLPATLDAMSDDQLADLAKNLPDPAAATAAAAPGDAPATATTEAAPMTREEMTAALAAAGEDRAALEAMSDDDLKALYDAKVGGAGGGGDGGVAAMGDPAAMTREELVAELTTLGEDAATLEGLTDDELRELYAILTGEPTAAAPAAATAAPAPVTPLSERRRGQPAAVAASRFAEIARDVDRAALRLSVQGFNAVRKADAEKFFEQLVRDGKQVPAAKALVVGQLMRADGVRVRHFSEKGKRVARTAYEQLKAEYAALPAVVRLGERVGQPAADAAGAAEREERAVERFAEVQAPALRAAGRTKEQFVQTFRDARKKDPALTAAKFGIPAEYAV